MLTYCKKDGWYLEVDRRQRGRRTDLHDAVETYDSLGPAAVALQHPVQYIRYHRGMFARAQALAEPRNFQPKVFWFYGCSGVGKSRLAWDLAGWQSEHTWVMPFNHGSTPWFDGYNAHESVIIDDIRKDTFSFAFLLQLLDRYPMQVQVKGAFVQWRPRIVLITCPFSPWDLYLTADDYSFETREGHIEQLVRRISESGGHIRQFRKRGDVLQTRTVKERNPVNAWVTMTYPQLVELCSGESEDEVSGLSGIDYPEEEGVLQSHENETPPGCHALFNCGGSVSGSQASDVSGPDVTVGHDRFMAITGASPPVLKPPALCSEAPYSLRDTIPSDICPDGDGAVTVFPGVTDPYVVSGKRMRLTEDDLPDSNFFAFSGRGFGGSDESDHEDQ